MRLPRRETAAEKNEVFCMIIQNALVYTPRHTFERGTLFIRNGRIVPFAAPEAGEEVIDAEGLYALPGLVGHGQGFLRRHRGGHSDAGRL